ncbi:hypothetical protein [Ruminococcus albus]|uniref:LPXTG-motif cell wall anchor domain-containing protein n=1 Tax=Ruminococcus albus (strain ATCC 27210 / DSM 20455 / JCM 14654 / NCDO 2250 / 7) TaxID=697329 RepID=E6UDX1_RUMA7|nr:hypothetical protein [Ruminococcus albus]ADU21758.1 hypothetical protein Rumal_1242 [Ruminococcus albus 7 = DSM 20455]
MIKKISAFAAAAIMAATMSVSAFAATYEQTVQAAKEAGVQSNNVQELDNFLQVHKDCFTSAQYDDMIADLNNIRDTYVAPYCKGGAKQVVNKAPADLTEADKILIGKEWTEADKKAIQDDLIALGKKHDVIVTITKVDDAHFSVAAEHKHGNDSSSNGNGNKNNNGGSGTTIKSDNPVAATGAETETSNAAAAVAAVSLAVAGFGVFMIAKKNKA